MNERRIPGIAMVLFITISSMLITRCIGILYTIWSDDVGESGDGNDLMGR